MVERFSVSADLKYMFLYLLVYVYIFGFFNAFLHQLVCLLWKNMHSLISNNRLPTHPFAKIFLKFICSISGKRFLEVYYIIFCLFMKKNGNFLHFSGLFFFYWAVSINSVQVTAVQFSTCCSTVFNFFGNW